MTLMRKRNRNVCPSFLCRASAAYRVQTGIPAEHAEPLDDYSILPIPPSS